MKTIEKRGSAKTIQDFYCPELDRNNIRALFEGGQRPAFDYKGIPEKLLDAIDNYRLIHIYTDYDGDGITSGAQMELVLNALGARVVLHTNTREEGYTIDINTIGTNKEGNELILMLDKGIMEFDSLKKAKEAGYECYVIDHHLPKRDDRTQLALIPPCDGFINPHVEMNDALIKGEDLTSYECIDYCASGLVRLVVERMMDLCPPEDKESILHTCNILAGIGTVGDSVSLFEKGNRYLVDRMITDLSRGYGTQGILQLASSAKMNVDMARLNPNQNPYLFFTPNDQVAFHIVPMINAYGRVGKDPGDVIDALLETDRGTAFRNAQKLIEANEQRKAWTEAAMESAATETESKELKTPMVIYCEKLPAGIVGLVASAVVERYGVSAVVLTDAGADADGRAIYRGSCRAAEGSDISLMLRESTDHLIQWGGHEKAAGLSIYADQVDALEQALQESADRHGYKPFTRDKIPFDVKIEGKDVKGALDFIAEKLQPCGSGYEMPVVCAEITVKNVFTMGSGKNHIKLTDEFGNQYVYFNYAENDKMDRFKPGDKVQVVGELTDNYFNGTHTPQIRAVAFADMFGKVYCREYGEDVLQRPAVEQKPPLLHLQLRDLPDFGEDEPKNDTGCHPGDEDF